MKRKNYKSFRILVVLSILVWVFVIIAGLLMLQLRGDLDPYAANDNELVVKAGGRVVDSNGAGVGGAKVTLNTAGVNNYFIADSTGRFVVSGFGSRKYNIVVSADNFRSYESALFLKDSANLNFTLHK